MEFKGVFTAIITPFMSGGDKIDYRAYEKLITRQIDAKIDGIVPCGTTGESPTLSHEEHRELIRKSVEFAGGKIRVIAGTGSNSTKEAVGLTEDACKAGVDAVMLVNPYYNKPTQEGLYRHFKTVAGASSVPVVLYNIKGRTAVNVEPETFVRLMDTPKICAIKEASGDLSQMSQIIAQCGKAYSLLSGDDNLIPAVMGIGGQGVISVASNLFPVKMKRMMAAYLKGDFAAGNSVFYSMLPLMNSLFWETNPIPVKAACNILGLCGADIRMPLVELSDDRKNKIKEILRQTGSDE